MLLYVLLPEGVYRYDPVPNALKPVAAGDNRGKVGPPAGANAAVAIVCIADEDDEFAEADTGFIGQYVYLFASAFGLNAWFRDVRDNLSGLLKFSDKQRALYAQPAGPPARR